MDTKRNFRDYCTENDCRKIILAGQNVVELKNYFDPGAIDLFCNGGCFQLWMIKEVEKE